MQNQTFTEGKDIWFGVYNDFKECKKSLNIKTSFFNKTRWIGSQEKILKENNCVKRNKSLLVKYLIKKKIYNYDILDLGGGIAIEYLNLRKYYNHLIPNKYFIVEERMIRKKIRELNIKQIFIINEKTQINNIDLFYACNSIHYVENLDMLIKYFSKITKTIILSGILINNFSFITAQYYYGEWIPVNFYSLNKLKKFFKELGFVLVYKKKSDYRYFGKSKKLPLNNFNEEYRKSTKLDLIFERL